MTDFLLQGSFHVDFGANSDCSPTVSLCSKCSTSSAAIAATGSHTGEENCHTNEDPDEGDSGMNTEDTATDADDNLRTCKRIIDAFLFQVLPHALTLNDISPRQTDTTMGGIVGTNLHLNRREI
jgi:hypothetical protein